MNSSIDKVEKRRGRPPVDSEQVTLRIATASLREIDQWRRGQDDLPSRPEAIRRLVERGLGLKK